MRLLTWLFLLPVAVAVAIFSANNQTALDVNLWPLPYAFTLPVYVVVLAGGFFGFITGAVASWISGGRARSKARRMTRRAEAAERERDRLAETVAKLESEARAANAPAALPAPVDANADKAA